MRWVGDPGLSHNISPFPSNASAPVLSSIARESVFEATLHARRPGMLILIASASTLTDGRSVEIIMYMPAAGAICNRRTTLSSIAVMFS